MGEASPPAVGELTSPDIHAAAASRTATAGASEPWAFPAANLPAALPPLGWPRQDAAAAATPTTGASVPTAPSGASSRVSPLPLPTPPHAGNAAETPSQTQSPQRSYPLTPATPPAVDTPAAVAAMTAVSAASVVTPPPTLRCPVAGCCRTFSRRSMLSSHARRHEGGLANGGPKHLRGSGGRGGGSGNNGGGGSGESSPGGGSSSTGGTPPPRPTKGVGKPGGLDAARIHVCKLCGRRFARRTSVTNHERSHYNERSLVNRRRRREAAAAASSSEDLVALGAGGRGGGRAAAAAPAAPTAAASPAQGTPPSPPSLAVTPSKEVDMHPSSGAPTSEIASPASTLMLGLSVALGAPQTASADAAAATACGLPSEAYGGAPPPPLPPPPPATAVSWFDVVPLSRQASNVTGVSSTSGILGPAGGELGPPAMVTNAYDLGVAVMAVRQPSSSTPVTATVPSTPPWRPTGASLPPLMPSPLSPTTSFADEGAGARASDYLPSPLESLWVAPSSAPDADGGMPVRSSGGVGSGDKVTSATQTVTSLDVALTTGASGLMSDGDATDRGSLVSAPAVGWLDSNPAAARTTGNAGADFSVGVTPRTEGAPSEVAAALDGPGWGVPEPTPGGADNMSMMPHLNSPFPPRDEMIERTLQELFEL